MENNKRELTPDMKILGSVELTSMQAELINKHAETILNGTVEQACATYKTIFDREPEEQTELEVFAALCKHVSEGNLLVGREMTWDDIPPKHRST